MSASSNSKVIHQYVPRRAASGLPQAASIVTLSGTSSGEIVIPGSGCDDRLIALKPTINCHIAFDIAGMAVADTTDLLFFGGQREILVVPRDVTTMRAIQAAGTSGGFLYWHISSTL